MAWTTIICSAVWRLLHTHTGFSQSVTVHKQWEGRKKRSTPSAHTPLYALESSNLSRPHVDRLLACTARTVYTRILWWTYYTRPTRGGPKPTARALRPWIGPISRLAMAPRAFARCGRGVCSAQGEAPRQIVIWLDSASRRRSAGRRRSHRWRASWARRSWARRSRRYCRRRRSRIWRGWSSCV